MAGTPSNLLTTITLAEPADSAKWLDIGGGQGSSQSQDSVIEGTESRARRCDNAIRGFAYNNGTAINLSAAGIHVGVWYNVFQPTKLNAAGIGTVLSGSSTSGKGTPWVQFNFLNTFYPAEGGFQRVWIDISRTPDASSGTINLASIPQIGAEVDIGDVGGNAPNFYQDRKDYGTKGISITGGTSGSPATFQDGITFSKNNALGVINENFLNAPVQIGGASSHFEDTTYNLKGGSQPLAATDWRKVIIDIQQATSVVKLLGVGFFGGIYFEILGSAGTCEFGAQTIEGSGNFALNSQVIFPVAWKNGGQVTWNGADIRGSVFDKSSPLLVNSAQSFLNKLENASFISSGSGYAMTWAEGVDGGNTTIQLNNIDFSGYGANQTTDAAINYTGSTAIQISYSGGTEPTVNGNATVIANQYPINVTVTDADTGSPLQFARVEIKKSSDKSLIAQLETDASGVASTTTTFTGGVEGWCRQWDLAGEDYTQQDFVGTITTSGISLTFKLKKVSIGV